jgi:AhpD family alkylhydroperoxidase
LWNQRRKYGRPLDSALLWARSPKLFLGVALLYGAIDRKRSPIEPALRSLLTVRVSQINHCRFCVDSNSATLLKRGVAFEKLEALDHWRESNLFGARERTALEYAEAATRPDVGVTDDLMGRLKEHFDDDAIVELTALIALEHVEQVQRRTRRAAPGVLSAAGFGQFRERDWADAARSGSRFPRRLRRVIMKLRGLTGAALLVGLALPSFALAQPGDRYWGPGMMWDGGGMVHMFFGFVMMILLLAVLAGLIVLVVRWLSHSGHSLFGPPGGQTSRTALDILKERLARGEIDVAEFEERKRALGE